MTTMTAPMTAICSATMTRINLVRRLLRMGCSTPRDRFARRDGRACCRSLATALGTNVAESSSVGRDISRGPHRILWGDLLKPDFFHRHRPPAQQIDLHPLDIGLKQVFKDRMVLGDPRGIVDGDALHLAVQHDPPRLVCFLPGLLQQLIDQGIAVERSVGWTCGVKKGKEKII